MILYKVVTRDYRESIMNLLMISRRNKKFSRCYKKGTVVEAEPNTLGIFCFTSRACAVQWINECTIPTYLYEILKVKPLTKPKRKIPKISKRLTEERISYFYYNLLNKPNSLDTINAPLGTVCVKRVEVLT